jgi:hypothetical protein
MSLQPLAGRQAKYEILVVPPDKLDNFSRARNGHWFSIPGTPLDGVALYLPVVH